MQPAYIVCRINYDAEHSQAVKLPETFIHLIDTFDIARRREPSLLYSASVIWELGTGNLILNTKRGLYYVHDDEKVSSRISMNNMVKLLNGNRTPPCEPDYIDLILGVDEEESEAVTLDRNSPPPF